MSATNLRERKREDEGMDNDEKEGRNF